MRKHPPSPIAPSSRGRRRCCAAAAVVLWAAAGGASAADWQVRPRLQAGATWSDNVGLARNGRESDLIMQVTPGITLTGDSARSNVNVDYNAQGLLFLDEGSRSTVNHQLQARIETELVRDRLSVYAMADAFQAVIDNTLPFSNNNLNFGANRADLFSYGAGMRFRQRLGSIGTFNLDYSYRDLVNSDGRTVDGTNDDLNWSLDLNEGMQNSRFRWDLAYNRQNSRYSGNSNDTFQQVVLNGSYGITRKIRLNGSVGYEFNSYRSGLSRSDDGATWSGGATFTPSQRTSLSASVGERVFGTTYAIDATHRMRRLVFSLRYDEELSTSSMLFRRLDLFPGTDPFGNPIPDPVTDGDLPLPIDTPQLLDETFVSKRLTGTVGYYHRRTSASLSVSREDRAYEVSLFEETSLSFTGTLSQQFSRALSAGLRLSWRDYERAVAGQDNTYVYLSPYVNYVLGRHLVAQLSYSHSDGSGGRGTFDYSQNTVTATVTYLF